MKNLDAKAKTLRVARLGEPRAGRRTPAPQPAPGKEFTESNYFINWDNAAVKGHAAQAVAGLARDASDWDKARGGRAVGEGRT